MQNLELFIQSVFWKFLTRKVLTTSCRWLNNRSVIHFTDSLFFQLKSSFQGKAVVVAQIQQRILL